MLPALVCGDAGVSGAVDDLSRKYAALSLAGDAQFGTARVQGRYGCLARRESRGPPRLTQRGRRARSGRTSSAADVREYLNATLQRRIMYIDGAMGTMIQRIRPALTEADFRGTRGPRSSAAAGARLLVATTPVLTPWPPAALNRASRCRHRVCQPPQGP